MAPIELSIPDYIHRYILVLSDDIPVLQNSFSEEQIGRLKGIAHLGLISKTRRLARHDKFEHAYGTYWLCKECAEATQGLIERKQYFRLVGILHGIGHLPFSYDTEYAVAKLYSIHPGTRTWLDSVFDTVVSFADHQSVNEAAKQMKSRLDYLLLHRWLGAYKIARSSASEFCNQPGRNVVRILVDTEHLEHQLLAQLDKIDFVLRDMLYLGFGRIELIFEQLLPQFTEDIDGNLKSPHLMSVIDATYRCLCDQIYLGPRERCLAQILEKSIVDATVRGALNVQELLNINDRELEDKLSDLNSGRRILDDSVERMNEGKLEQVSRLLCNIGRKPFVEIERNLVGTTVANIHKYHVNKGTYIQCLPKAYFHEMEEYEWTEEPSTVLITYDFESRRPEHTIGALILAEKLAPENLYGIEMPCREEALRFLTGLNVHPDFDRYGVVRNTIARHVPKENWKPELLFNEPWERLHEDPIGELYWEYDVDWLVIHFLEFPEHWSTNIIERVLSDVQRTLARPTRRRNETEQQCQARIEVFMEYSTYLETVLRLRTRGLLGWVLPAVWFLDENGAKEVEVDVCAIYAPKPHHRPITLELHEISRDDSPNNRDDNRRKLENKILYRVRNRFDEKISVLGYFNGQELFRWPPVSRP